EILVIPQDNSQETLPRPLHSRIPRQLFFAHFQQVVHNLPRLVKPLLGLVGPLLFASIADEEATAITVRSSIPEMTTDGCRRDHFRARSTSDGRRARIGWWSRYRCRSAARSPAER